MIWLVVAFASRYSSLAALIASAATPAVLWSHDEIGDCAALFLPLAVLLWIMHRANIARLINGTESKIGRKSAAAWLFRRFDRKTAPATGVRITGNAP